VHPEGQEAGVPKSIMSPEKVQPELLQAWIVVPIPELEKMLSPIPIK